MCGETQRLRRNLKVGRREVRVLGDAECPKEEWLVEKLESKEEGGNGVS